LAEVQPLCGSDEALGWLAHWVSSEGCALASDIRTVRKSKPSEGIATRNMLPSPKCKA
jgi:hypothetical protein